jgi:hypothetical protein
MAKCCNHLPFTHLPHLILVLEVEWDAVATPVDISHTTPNQVKEGTSISIYNSMGQQEAHKVMLLPFHIWSITLTIMPIITLIILKWG